MPRDRVTEEARRFADSDAHDRVRERAAQAILGELGQTKTPEDAFRIAMRWQGVLAYESALKRTAGPSEEREEQLSDVA